MKKTIRSIFLFTILSSFSIVNANSQLKHSICHNLPSIDGWCSREKALTFVDLVLEIKPEVCVDIGTFGGSSLFPVASTLKFLKQGHIIAIDPWDRGENLQHFDLMVDPVNSNWWQTLDFDSIYTSYCTMIYKYSLTDYCITLKMTSEQAASQIEDIDILHVDGGHSEKAFTKDILLYLPKVRNGGYILLNDSLWEQAQPAVELLLQQCEVIKLIDGGNCILFKKIDKGNYD